MLKARHRIKESGSLPDFDLKAPIVPLVGAGGVTFKHRLNDFEFLLTEKIFAPSYRPDVSIELDKEYYLLTIRVQKTALQVQFDIITGKINLISCGRGYQGAFNDTLYPGVVTKGDFYIKTGLGYDLDLYWFSRYPFDGLVIYPPGELRDDCWDSGAIPKPYPEFTVDEVIILDYNYAVKQHGKELRLEEKDGL